MFLSATLVNYQRGLKLEFRARWCCADSVLNEKAGSDRELSGCLAVEQLSEAMDGPYDTDEDGVKSPPNSSLWTNFSLTAETGIPP